MVQECQDESLLTSAHWDEVGSGLLPCTGSAVVDCVDSACLVAALQLT